MQISAFQDCISQFVPSRMNRWWTWEKSLPWERHPDWLRCCACPRQCFEFPFRRRPPNRKLDHQWLGLEFDTDWDGFWPTQWELWRSKFAVELGLPDCKTIFCNFSDLKSYSLLGDVPDYAWAVGAGGNGFHLVVSSPQTDDGFAVLFNGGQQLGLGARIEKVDAPSPDLAVFATRNHGIP